MSKVRRGIGAVLTTVVCVGAAMARVGGVQYLPADRLIENATAYVQEEPNDPSGYYTLARIHYLAFANKALVVATSGGKVVPRWRDGYYLDYAREQEATRRALEEFGYASEDDVPSEMQQAFFSRVWQIKYWLTLEGWQPPWPETEVLVNHAAAAEWNFHRAIALDPNNALYYLGLASLEEQYLDFFGEANWAQMPAALKAIALTGVKDTYLLSYNLSIQDDLKLEYRPIEGLAGIISYEAGNAYVRLWEAEESIPADVQERIDEMKANLAKMAALPIGAVTPIVFSTQGHTSLAELLAPQRIVRFDLDGDGRVERRPWVQPTTGLLVWDADGDGKIASGRELFGSVTWWLFFTNGYRAMDLLDDNRDGLLMAGELKGIAVWFDTNSDGRTDGGEVVSLDSLGIEAIATHSTGRDGVCPMHSSGIRLKGGRTLPSYDWIAPAVRGE